MSEKPLPTAFPPRSLWVAAWCIACFALLLPGGGVAPTVASAQVGYYVTPSFSASEVYDDNLFFTPSARKQDYISRFTPGVEAGYRSVPLTLLGHYSFDAERYARNPDLNKNFARQDASLEFRYLPEQRLTLGLNGSFVKTRTPQELNVTTGLAASRVRAQSISVNPSVAYRFGALTTGRGDYSFVRDEISGGTPTDTHTVNLGLDRRLSRRDTGSLGYSFSRYVFGGQSTVDSQAFTLGWSRDLTPLTRFTLRAGPRVTRGKVRAEVSASVRHTLSRGEVSFSYARSQATVLGVSEPVKTDSFTAAGTYQLLRLLTVSAAPSYIRTSLGGAVAKVYELNFGAIYRFTEWLSLNGSYRFDFQQGSIAGLDEHIIHNVALVSLSVSYPYRVY